MQEQDARKGYLILENGRVFQGYFFGEEREAIGELVFTTAMTGYLETLTDPSYYGQLVIQTFPLIGNYGVIPGDFESARPFLKAYIVREWCQQPSNFRSEGRLDAFLKQEGVPGLYGIDTRALTRIVREQGVMNAKLSFTPDADEQLLSQLKNFRIKNAVNSVSAQSPGPAPAGNGPKVVLWDFGAKLNIERELIKRGCQVKIMQANAKAEEILQERPDGIMLSNGPGDPSENASIIEELRKICARKLPIFGICLGHQLLALASGAKTGKLKYGHRGANQPCTETATGRVYITSQNHGYAVLNETLPPTPAPALSTPTTAPARAWNITTCPPFQCNSIPKPRPAPRIRPFSLINLRPCLKNRPAVKNPGRLKIPHGCKI